MRSPLLLTVTIVLIFVVNFLADGLLGKGHRDLGPPVDQPAARQYERIVSTAPSLTETLYALGLGDRVVGVSRYCDYPSQVVEKPKVGGYHDPNFEAIVGLRPDLVVLLDGDEQSRSAFDTLGLTTLVVCHKSVDDILDSFARIGRHGGVEDRAAKLTAAIEARMERIRQKTLGLPRPRVLFVIERTIGHGQLEDVCVAGSDDFLDQIVTLAGGRSAYPSATVRFPVVSTEGLLWMDPQVILDMTVGLVQGEQSNAAILADWQQVDQVEAVRNGRVHALKQGYAFRPGPRFILLV
ncbi:MAG: helical backbone metal receptor, partial [Thermoguttaceae bacterium]